VNTGRRLAVGVMISGRGSNLQALLDACAEADFPARIVLVVSNRADAPGLSLAKAAGVPVKILPQHEFTSREACDTAITEAFEAAQAELICLAGFMRLLSAGFVGHWRDRLINIHPSLLPDFKGLDTHRRALASGAKEHGCSVHYVRQEMDSGPIIGQTRVPVLPGDSAETLAARVLEAEHKLYPRCLRLIAEGRVRGQITEIIDAG